MRRQPTSLATLLMVMLWATPGKGTAQECVDINTATTEELRLIVHEDEVRAQEIATLRAQTPFASVDQLVRVRGIAAARLRDIKAQRLACVQDRAMADLLPNGRRLYLRWDMDAR